jgi:hypothetical protein
MNRTVQTVSFKSAMPALALGAVLMLLGPTAALAQRGGGGRGGHSGGVIPAVRSRAAVDAAILPRRTRAAAIPAVGAAMPPPTRAAAIPAGAAMPRPTRPRYSGGRGYYGGGILRWRRRLLPWPVLRRPRLLLRWTLLGSSLLWRRDRHPVRLGLQFGFRLWLL